VIQCLQSLISTARQRLGELGWSEGRNIRIDERWAGGDADRLRAYAAELVSLKPDVIFGEGTPVVAALQQATRTIPIVFLNANNPIGFGFVASMARPGGNITGFVSAEPAMGGKWLETLREIAPDVARVALIYNPQTHTGQYFQSIDSASQSLAVKIIPLPFRDSAEIERALGDFAREPKGGLPSCSARHQHFIASRLDHHAGGSEPIAGDLSLSLLHHQRRTGILRG
jgi:putative ABC transport system substrate-binding protein